jgi:hypothetical protein
VEVGPEKILYTLYQDLITRHSGHFRNVCTELELSEQTITLLDTEPLVFEMFVNWMYGATLPHSHEWQSLQKHTVVTNVDDWQTYDYVTVLVKAYKFGKDFSVPAFQKAILLQVTDYVLPRHTITRFHALVFAYQNLPWDDPLLEFLVAFHCKFCNGTHYTGNKEGDPDSEKGRSQLKEEPDLLVALLALYANKASRSPGWFKGELVACDYHGHVTTKEREICEKEGKAGVY